MFLSYLLCLLGEAPIDPIGEVLIHIFRRYSDQLCEAGHAD
jgi:hypothetical protein